MNMKTVRKFFEKSFKENYEKILEKFSRQREKYAKSEKILRKMFDMVNREQNFPN